MRPNSTTATKAPETRQFDHAIATLTSAAALFEEFVQNYGSEDSFNSIPYNHTEQVQRMVLNGAHEYDQLAKKIATILSARMVAPATSDSNPESARMVVSWLQEDPSLNPQLVTAYAEQFLRCNVFPFAMEAGDFVENEADIKRTARHLPLPPFLLKILKTRSIVSEAFIV